MSKFNAYLLIVVSILGIAVSWYALALHNKPAGDSFCNFNARFNCDVVNQGQYSELSGIPVAIFGIAGYAVLLIGALIGLRSRDIWQYLIAISALGLAFALYLTFIEAFVLYTYCIVCLTSQLLILIAFILTVLQWRTIRKNRSQPHDSTITS